MQSSVVQAVFTFLVVTLAMAIDRLVLVDVSGSKFQYYPANLPVNFKFASACH